MKLKKKYEDKILTEIKNLSEHEIEKVFKVIHLLKTEFIGGKKKTSIERFKRAKGAWKDVDVEGIYKCQ